jgi:hypothetical protein
MSEWLKHLLNSFTHQAGTWFVGAVLALLGLLSARITEKIKFALNRADIRIKYYEEMATNMSHIVFIIDRLARVYYRSNWASDEDKSAIANEYNETMNSIFQKEYVYLSWLKRYWGQQALVAFTECMKKLRCVDLVLIQLNDAGNEKHLDARLTTAHRELTQAVDSLLTATI